MYRPKHVPGVGEQSRQLELAQATVTDTRTELAGLTVELRAARAEIDAEQQRSTARLAERAAELREHLH